jgi:type IV pilus assembly protein PilM
MLASRTTIGVDIGGRTLKAAQLVRSGRQVRLYALSLLPRPEAGSDIGVADVAALREALKRQGFAGRRIAIAAPETALLRASLELPARVTGAPAGQIVRMELSRLHSIPPTAFEMAYWDLTEASGNKPVTQALAVGCRHEAANALLDLFESAGFRVTALDVRAAAVARACMPLMAPAPQVTAVADLGWHSTSVLFVCGRSLIYERSLRGDGVADLHQRLTNAFDLAPDAVRRIIDTIGPAASGSAEQSDQETLEAIRTHVRAHFDKLIEELRVPVSYVNHHFPGDGVKRLLLVGGGGTVPGLASYAADALGINVQVARPSDVVESLPALLTRAANPVMTAAVGLAMSEAAR